MSKRIIKILVLSAIIFSALVGCDTQAENIQRLFGSLIVNDDGSLDMVAYESALGKKFQVGSPTKKLLSYVESQGGTCASKNNEYSCRIYYYTTLCIASYVDITFNGLEVINDLKVNKGSEGC